MLTDEAQRSWCHTAFVPFYLALLAVMLAAFFASLAYAVIAILRKGQRGRLLRNASVCVLVFATFFGTQQAIQLGCFNQYFTPVQTVLFALPAVIVVVGIVVSLAFAGRAVLRNTGPQRRRLLRRSLIALFICIIGVAPHSSLILLWCLPTPERAGTLTRVGQPAPDFSVVSIEGAAFRLSDLRGRVVLLNFFATWCGPCHHELPHLQAIWEEFEEDASFRMIAIGREESDEAVKAFKRERHFTFPTGSDRDGAIYGKYASQSIPRTYLISRDGTIIYQCAGYYEQETAKLKRLLRKELAKKTRDSS